MWCIKMNKYLQRQKQLHLFVTVFTLRQRAITHQPSQESHFSPNNGRLSRDHQQVSRPTNIPKHFIWMFLHSYILWLMGDSLKVMCKVLFQNPHVPMYSPRIQLWIISRNTEPRGEDARQQWQLGPFDIFLKKMADNLIRKVCKRSGMCGRKKGR